MEVSGGEASHGSKQREAEAEEEGGFNFNGLLTGLIQEVGLWVGYLVSRLLNPIQEFGFRLRL